MKATRTSRLHQQLIRLAFRESSTEGQLDNKKVASWAILFAARKPHEALILLRTYRFLIANQIAKETALVKAAWPLSAQEQHELLDRIRDRFPSVHSLLAQEDKSILGGITVRIGDSIWDGSLKTRVQQLGR